MGDLIRRGAGLRPATANEPVEAQEPTMPSADQGARARSIEAPFDPDAWLRYERDEARGAGR